MASPARTRLNSICRKFRSFSTYLGDLSMQSTDRENMSILRRIFDSFT